MLKEKLKTLFYTPKANPSFKEGTSRLGSDYGGWCIYLPSLSKESIVYSGGIGENITFDIELIKAIDCEIYAFDPTPKSINWLTTQTISPKFKAFNFGLSDNNYKETFYPPDNNDWVSHTTIKQVYQTDAKGFEVQMYTLEHIMNEHGHSHIDLLKIDIEGSEFQLIDWICERDLDIRQIVVEFHHHFPNVHISRTKSTIQKLVDKNYQIFDCDKSLNQVGFIKT